VISIEIKMSLIQPDKVLKKKYKQIDWPNPTLLQPRASSRSRIEAGVALSAFFSGNFGWMVGKLHKFTPWDRTITIARYTLGATVMAAAYFPLNEILYG
jgi:hypothetical protein